MSEMFSNAVSNLHAHFMVQYEGLHRASVDFEPLHLDDNLSSFQVMVRGHQPSFTSHHYHPINPPLKSAN